MHDRNANYMKPMEIIFIIYVFLYKKMCHIDIKNRNAFLKITIVDDLR